MGDSISRGDQNTHSHPQELRTARCFAGRKVFEPQPRIVGLNPSPKYPGTHSVSLRFGTLRSSRFVPLGLSFRRWKWNCFALQLQASRGGRVTRTEPTSRVRDHPISFHHEYPSLSDAVGRGGGKIFQYCKSISRATTVDSFCCNVSNAMRGFQTQGSPAVIAVVEDFAMAKIKRRGKYKTTQTVFAFVRPKDVPLSDWRSDWRDFA